jgi:HAD superfamily hydrolase (TIGR01490 family)
MAESMERVLCPLVYAEPMRLLERHRALGEPSYVLSASLHEIVCHIALDLGFDGCVGSTCEIVGGVYTGRALRPCYGEYKAGALRELAAREGIDLGGSTAYSDSHTDLAFLEAVGRPVAVNPDRKLRAIAADRGWPVLEFDRRLRPPRRPWLGRVPAAD